MPKFQAVLTKNEIFKLNKIEFDKTIVFYVFF